MTLNASNRRRSSAKSGSRCPRQHALRNPVSFASAARSRPVAMDTFPFPSAAVKRDRRDAGTSIHMPPLLQLRDIVADPWRRAASGRRGFVNFGRRPDRAGRAQRLGQIDAVSCRGRRHGGRRRNPLRPARRASPICRRSPTCPASRRRSPMCWPGPHGSDDPYRARAMMAELGLDPARILRAFPAAKRAGRLWSGLWRRARHPAARRADQPPRSHRHRMARGAARAEPLGARPHQP